MDASNSSRRRFRKTARRGMDLDDVVNPLNVSSRYEHTPPAFVKEWIERPQNAASPEADPSTNGPFVLNKSQTISTADSFPGSPLLIDDSPDSHFWARVFDMEVLPPPNIADFFYPLREERNDHPQTLGDSRSGQQQQVFHSQPVVAGSIWMASIPTVPSSEGNPREAGEVLPGSSIWASVSGPIGGLGGGDSWNRPT